MKNILIALALGSTAIGGIAYAGQTTPTPAPKAVKGDTDGDGTISRAEFIARAEAAFKRMDTNGDGRLTADERRAGHGHKGRPGPAVGGPFEPVAGQDAAPPPPPPPGEMGGQRGRGGRGGGMAMMMQRADTDGDGKISKAEFAAQSAQRFQRLDTNGDGTIDKTEMAAAPGGGRGMARRDGNADGALTRAEFDARSAQRFDRMDTNGDGYLDAAEMAAMRPGGPGAPPPKSPQPAPKGA